MIEPTCAEAVHLAKGKQNPLYIFQQSKPLYISQQRIELQYTFQQNQTSLSPPFNRVKCNPSYTFQQSPMEQPSVHLSTVKWNNF